jgi:hypothetical protein
MIPQALTNPDIAVDSDTGFLAPLDAMQIVAYERLKLHQKILRLRAIREAAEASREIEPKAKVRRR